jgi:hypothetical protein
MKNFIHEVDEAVFGSSMCALMYAYVNQIPLFYSTLNKPKLFEHFDTKYSFSNINNKNEILCNNEMKTYGIRKVDLWNGLSFVLSLEGLMPLADNASSARLDEDLLKVTTKNSKVIRIKFNKLHMFEENIEGLPGTTQINNEGIVYDYFEFDTLHEYKTMFIETNEDFVNQVYITGRKGVIISKVEDLTNEIPDYAIKFRLFELTKQYNIIGRQNGIYHYRKELKIPRFKKLEVRFNHRLVQKTKLNEYREQNNLTFMQSTDTLEGQLLEQIKPNRLWNRLKF